LIDPTPPDPPAMKPPIEAVLYVDGCSLSSWPESFRVARSRSARIAPGPLTTRPGETEVTASRLASDSTTPPESGIAWP
jgi:hypothetical protein